MIDDIVLNAKGDLVIYEANKLVRKKLFPMFKDIESTIVLSCLQGHMGSAWVDDLENPSVAQIIVGIFVYYAGNPKAKGAEELLNNLPEHTLVIVNTKEWKSRVEALHKGQLIKLKRYRFKKNKSTFDINNLNHFIKKLSKGYEIKKIDKNLAEKRSLNELSTYFISQFYSIDDFLKRGVGFCVLHSGKIVSAATSYSIYDDGIEIELATSSDHMRKGLATAVSAKLILDSLNQNKYPNWDAANIESLKLAQKLGYVLSEEYDTYYINYKR